MQKTVAFPESRIRSLKKKVFKVLIVDKSKDIVVEGSDHNTVSLAFSGIYKLDDNSLAIAINDSYFKIILSNKIASHKKLLDLTNFGNATKGDTLSVNKSDSRVINFDHKLYQISSHKVSKEELNGFFRCHSRL
ncbi:NisI/SpaI family lantibiotic immunity lipoprotein [Streptococcus catagoni]|uniref:NisI/SpaI family lantibiotic immunity lipoprotein n=1 Tax=Streptococcus catagoni TaxID=2654874 RepID=UPI00140732D3|nr:NisI/SpaI family lantibiotic immunity lipoprotein [Streptococcus catagoni]